MFVPITETIWPSKRLKIELWTPEQLLREWFNAETGTKTWKLSTDNGSGNEPRDLRVWLWVETQIGILERKHPGMPLRAVVRAVAGHGLEFEAVQLGDTVEDRRNWSEANAGGLEAERIWRLATDAVTKASKGIEL